MQLVNHKNHITGPLGPRYNPLPMCKEKAFGPRATWCLLCMADRGAGTSARIWGHSLLTLQPKHNSPTAPAQAGKPLIAYTLVTSQPKHNSPTAPAQTGKALIAYTLLTPQPTHYSPTTPAQTGKLLIAWQNNLLFHHTGFTGVIVFRLVVRCCHGDTWHVDNFSIAGMGRLSKSKWVGDLCKQVSFKNIAKGVEWGQFGPAGPVLLQSWVGDKG